MELILKPGSSFVLRAGHVHCSWTGDEETIAQACFMGPAGVTFVNPQRRSEKKMMLLPTSSAMTGSLHSWTI
jgi:hypothetical protein